MKGDSLAIIKFLWELKLLLLKLAVWGVGIFFPRRRLPRVLIIKPDHLGDFLISLSAFQGLCRHYRDRGYRITILVSSFNRPLAEASPLFDEVICCNMLHADFTFPKRYRLYRRLYSERFSVVIDPQYFPGSYQRSHTMALLCRARCCCTVFNFTMIPAVLTPRERYLKVDRWRKHFSLFFEDTSPSVMEAGFRFAERICGQRFPRCLYADGFGELPSPPSLPHDYYVVVPGAASRRPWPIARFAELIERIHRQHPGAVAVLTGGGNEAHLGEELRKTVPAEIPLVDRIGASTLLELCAIFRSARFIVTNDTGTAHLAPLMSTPGVVISGGWHVGAYLPNPLYPGMHCLFHRMECGNCGWKKCLHERDGVDGCVAEISVDEVMRVVDELKLPSA